MDKKTDDQLTQEFQLFMMRESIRRFEARLCEKQNMVNELIRVTGGRPIRIINFNQQ